MLSMILATETRIVQEDSDIIINISYCGMKSWPFVDVKATRAQAYWTDFQMDDFRGQGWEIKDRKPYCSPTQ